MPFGRGTFAAAQSAALTCAMLTFAGVTLSAGASLARLIPDDVPPGLMFWFSGLVLILGAAAIRFHPESLNWSVAQRIAVGTALWGGTFLTACAWAANGWWLLALTVAGTALGAAAVSIWSLKTGHAASPAASPATDEPSTEESVADAELRPRQDRPATQRILRRCDAGRETLSVEWRIRFDPGQQHQSMHLPISPPFVAAPAVECEPIDGDDVELSVGAVHPYGIRIEARRTGDASRSADCVIGLELSAPSTADAA